MDYATLGLSMLALGLAAGAIFRRRNEVQHNLRVQLDEALEENQRLLAERAKLQDELHAAKVAASSPERLSWIAGEAVRAAAQLSTTPAERLRHALEVARALDDSDGHRDFTDKQIRLAIEAEVARRKVAQ